MRSLSQRQEVSCAAISSSVARGRRMLITLLCIDLVLCERNGVTCNNRGRCGPGIEGCICDSGGEGGEDYC